MLQDVKIKYFDEEIDIYNERGIVNKKTSTIQLDKIPSDRGIYIKHGKKSLIEVQFNPDVYEFVADRETGVLLFNSEMNGKLMEIDYSAIGKFCLSADKIYTNVSNSGDILETLEELLTENHKVIESVKTVGDGATVITQLQADIDGVTGLSGKIIEGTAVNDKLTKIVDIANESNITLNDTVNTANTKIDEMNEWIRIHGDIVDLDNRVDSVEIEIPKISESLTNITQNFEEHILNHPNEDYRAIINDTTSTNNKCWSSEKTNTEILKVQSGFKVPVLTENPTQLTEGMLWIVRSTIVDNTQDIVNTLSVSDDINLSTVTGSGHHSLITFKSNTNYKIRNVKVLMKTRESEIHQQGANIMVEIGVFSNNTFTKLSQTKTYVSPSQPNTKFILNVDFAEDIIFTKNLEYAIKLYTTTSNTYISLCGNTNDYNKSIGSIYYSLQGENWEYTSAMNYDVNMQIIGEIVEV